MGVAEHIMHRIMPHIIHITPHIMHTMPHRIMHHTMPHRIMHHTMPHRIMHHIMLHITPHRIMHHLLQPIVEMELVIMGKHVIHVYKIVLVQIVIIVIIQITRLLHGWNAQQIVVVINHGFHQLEHFVVAQNKIMQHHQQDIFLYIGQNVRVMYYPFVETECVTMENYVVIVQ